MGYSPECVEKLSEKVSEQPSEGGSGRYEESKWGEIDLLGGLWGYATGACKAFRTVSLGTLVNKGKSEGWAMGKPTSNSGKEKELLRR